VSAHAAHKKILNTSVLKNYHSHDHCLLGKWKRARCLQQSLERSFDFLRKSRTAL